MATDDEIRRHYNLSPQQFRHGTSAWRRKYQRDVGGSSSRPPETRPMTTVQPRGEPAVVNGRNASTAPAAITAGAADDGIAAGIRQLRQFGRTDDLIRQGLLAQGVSEQDINRGFGILNPGVTTGPSGDIDAFSKVMNAVRGRDANYNAADDTNNDGVVNFTDFLAFAQRIGPNGGPSEPPGDGPLDPVVDPNPPPPDISLGDGGNGSTSSGGLNNQALRDLGRQQTDLAGQVASLQDILTRLQQPREAPDMTKLFGGFRTTLNEINAPFLEQQENQRLAQQSFMNDFQARQQNALDQLRAEQATERERNAPLNAQIEQLLASRMGQFDESGRPINDAVTRANLAEIERRHVQEQEQLATMLQGLGVLRGSGSPIDKFGELTGLQGQQILDEEGRGQQRQERSYQDALQLLDSRRTDRNLDDTILNRARSAGLGEMGLGLQATGQLNNLVGQGRSLSLNALTGLGSLMGVGPDGGRTLAAQQLYGGDGQGNNTLANVFGTADRTGYINGQDTLQRFLGAGNLGVNQRRNEISAGNILGTLGGQQTLGGREQDFNEAAATAGGAMDLAQALGIIGGTGPGQTLGFGSLGNILGGIFGGGGGPSEDAIREVMNGAGVPREEAIRILGGNGGGLGAGLGQALGRIPGMERLVGAGVPGIGALANIPGMSGLAGMLGSGGALSALPGIGQLLGIGSLVNNIPGLGWVPGLGDVGGALGSIGGGIRKGLGKIFSDENLKEQVSDLSSEEILAKLKATPVKEWQYKSSTGLGTKRHIGPMAQDFAKFGTDTNEGGVRTIDTVDAFGVNFAASKALAEKVDSLEAQIAKLTKAKRR